MQKYGMNLWDLFFSDYNFFYESLCYIKVSFVLFLIWVNNCLKLIKGIIKEWFNVMYFKGF